MPACGALFSHGGNGGRFLPVRYTQCPLAPPTPWQLHWRLLGDSVSVQWVPSQVGVKGHEREGTVRGSAQAFRDVLRDREV